MRQPSMKDVARAAGVSLGTVSNVLNRRSTVDSELVDRVHAAIAALGYVRNESARQLRAGDSQLIAFVLFDAGNPFFSEVSRAAAETALAADCFVMVADSHDSRDAEAELLRRLEQQRVRGLLVAPFGDVSDDLLRLRARGVPVVVVGSRSSSPHIPSVRTDDVAGGRLALEHLLERGATRITVLSGPAHLEQVEDRITGARAAVLAMAPDLRMDVRHAASSTVEAGETYGRELAAMPAHERPDGVFATSDLLALGFLNTMARNPNLAVPRDVMVVGYDDIPWAEAAPISLTTIRQQRRRIGVAAVDLLLAGAGEERAADLVFAPTLVIRDSSRVD